MNTKLTLGEKLKDLRTAKKLKLDDVSEATGISTSTLQRLENDEDIRVGYQDIETLARFYDCEFVSVFAAKIKNDYTMVPDIEQQTRQQAIQAISAANLKIDYNDFGDSRK